MSSTAESSKQYSTLELILSEPYTGAIVLPVQVVLVLLILPLIVYWSTTSELHSSSVDVD